MEEMTLGIIHTFKNFGTYNAKKHLLDFLSEYTLTPKRYYSNESLIGIARNAFIDYIRFCDNPGYEIYSFFDIKRRKEDLKKYNYKLWQQEQNEYDLLNEDFQAIAATLCNTQVKELDTTTKNYKYVNNFRKPIGFLKEVLDKLESEKEKDLEDSQKST